MDLKILIVALIVIIILIYFTSNISFRKILFHPTHTNNNPPDIPYKSYFVYRDGSYEYETDQPKDADYINIWLFNNYYGREFILYFHGNMGNVRQCNRMISIARQFKFNLLLVDYRGYGISHGIATPDGILEDGQTAYDFLLKFTTPDKIVVWGESMGGSVSTYVAKNNKIKALVLLSTFSCLNDISKYGDYGVIMKHLADNITCLVSNLPIYEWLQYVKVPVLIGHSYTDGLIDIKCAFKNFDSIKHNMKDFIIYEGPHANPNINEKTIKKILDFIVTDYTYNQIEKLITIIKKF